MRRLIESGAVPGNRFVQIGLRGYWPPPATVAWMREQRMRSFFMADITRRGLDDVVDEGERTGALPGKILTGPLTRQRAASGMDQ